MQAKDPLDLLIEKFQTKDETAFEKLYEMYKDSIHGIVYKIVNHHNLADEVTQDTFIKAWNNAHRYSSQKGRFFTWILNIAKNTAIDKLRSKSFRKSNKTLNTDAYINVIKSSENLDNQTDAIGIKEIVKTLTPNRHKIIDLLYFKGFTQQEASDFLKIPLGTVKSRSRNSIQQLKTMLL